MSANELVYTDLENREKPLAEGEAAIRKQQVSNVLYTYKCLLTEGPDQYRGEFTVQFTYKKVASHDGTFLDFFGKTITLLEVNGVNLLSGTKDEVDSLWLASRVALKDKYLKDGQENVVKIHFINDYDHTGAGFHTYQDPEDKQHYVYTNFEPYDCRRWMPNFDQPAIKGKLTLTVVSPANWHVIANSRAIDTKTTSEHKEIAFEQTPPISSYIFALIAGPYEQFVDSYAEDRVPLAIYCRKSLAKYIDTDELFQVTKQGLGFYENFFGMKYPFSKYDQLFVPEFNHGAMENVGAVTFTERYIFRDTPTEARRVARADTVLHEMAHMWFGDLVTMEWWNGLWLNESFATYIAALAVAESTRFGALSWLEFNSGMKSWAYREDQLPTTHPVEGAVPDTDATFNNFDGITYGKGASLLKQLVHVVGMEGFKAGMRWYFNKYTWGNTTIHDFLAALEHGAKETGTAFDPVSWSKMWLEEAGLNTLSPKITLTADNSKIDKLEVIQNHPPGHPTMRRHAVQIALFDLDTATDKPVLRKTIDAVILPQTHTTVEAAHGEKAPAFCYVNYGDHGYAKVLLDEHSEKFALKYLDKFDDALLRQLLWQDIYNMARDAKMKSTAYIQLAKEKLLSESDPKLVQAVLTRVQAALHNFVPETIYEHEASELYKFTFAAFKQAVESGKSKEWQIIWANTLIAFARSKSEVEELTKYLAPEHSKLVGDFELEQGMRWSVVIRACSHGLPNAQQLLDAEAARDKSDRGTRSVLTAKTSFPDAKVKQDAWERYVAKEQKMSSHNSAADMGGFRWRHQKELMNDYVDKFFDVVRSIYKDHPRQYSESFFDVLFPDEPENDYVVSRAEDLLADLNPEEQILRKSLKQVIDGLYRSRACLALFK